MQTLVTRRATLIALALAALVASASTGLLARHHNRGGAPIGTAGSSPFDGPTMPPGMRAPDFVLHDQGGRRVRFADYRGQPVILAFMHSECHETCPVMTQVIRGALDDLGARISVLAVSVAPGREDTPTHARAFIRRQHMTGRMRFLLGHRPRLRPIWRAYGVRPQGRNVEHTAFTFLVDRRGIVRVGYPGNQMTPEDVAHDLGVLRRERG